MKFRKLKVYNNNSSYSRMQEDYMKFHTLPEARENPTRYSVTFALAIFILMLVVFLFLYASLRVIQDSETIKQNLIPLIVCLLFAVSFLVILMLAVKKRINSLRNWKSIEKQFVEGEGIIIGKWTESKAQVDNSGGMEYYIAVQYTIHTKVKASVTSRVFNKLVIQQKIKLRYVPKQPEISEIHGLSSKK